MAKTLNTLRNTKKVIYFNKKKNSLTAFKKLLKWLTEIPKFRLGHNGELDKN